MKDHFNNFQDKMNQYLLRKFNNPRYIIIVVHDIEDQYSHFDMDNPSKLSKE